MFCIYGAGGHAKDILAQLDSEQSNVVLSFIDDFSPDRMVAGIPVLTFEAAISRFPYAEWLIGVGSSADRRRISEVLNVRKLREGRLTSDLASIAKSAEISAGTQIFAGSRISSDVRIGRGVIINYNCSISHDCVVDDFATISPGCSIAGRVRIEAEAFIGVGASVINGTSDNPITIGKNATVGAGAVVIRSVADGDIVVGVPARSIRGK